MKSRFFVVFSRDALKPPKLYQRKPFAEKKCAQYPNYAYQSFLEEAEASKFFNEKFLEAKQKLIEAPLTTLKSNLSLKTSKVMIQQPLKLQDQTYIDQSQKQQRQKTVNKILKEHRIFKQAKFKPTVAKVPLNKDYSGYFDGASAGNPGKSAIGYHIDNMLNESVIMRSQFIGMRTNSQAEMIAMILMLGDAYCHGIKRFKCFGDSLMAIKFMTGEYGVRNQLLMYYFNAANLLRGHFEAAQFTHIERAYNFKADRLSQKDLKNVVVYRTKEKSDFSGGATDGNDVIQK